MEDLQLKIRKLQDESDEERQRMEQASKALNFCVSQDEFEGSSERVRRSTLLIATRESASPLPLTLQISRV